MHDRFIPTAFLKQISTNRQNHGQSQASREIVATLGDRSVTLGRDPSCEIAVDINIYGEVSRRHAEIRPIFAKQKFKGWEICDLDSANGTFINDIRLYSCYPLNHGDLIKLTLEGPEFIFEQEPFIGTLTSLRPRSQITRITLTKLLPIFQLVMIFGNKLISCLWNCDSWLCGDDVRFFGAAEVI